MKLPIDHTEVKERRAWEREQTEPLSDPFTAAFVTALADPRMHEWARTTKEPWNRKAPLDRPMAEAIVQSEADRLKSLFDTACITARINEPDVIPLDQDQSTAA